MRDRLIELLRQPFPIIKGYDTIGESRLSYVECEEIADRLLANGVVVIRCNIGDIVYQTDGVRIYELSILDVSLYKNKPYYETDEIDFDDNAIGKSIFLTREEAESKLQEGEG